MTTQQKSISIVHSLYEQIALVLAGSLVMILSAKIMVPFWPVPLTFSPFAAIVLGILMGPRLGSAAVMAYLFEGLIGLPVFAGSDHIPFLMRPTAGFLMGFPIAAYVAGYLKQEDWTLSAFKSTALFLISYAIIYTMGLTWLVSFVGLHAAVTSLLLCIPGDLAKIGLGVAVIQAYRMYKK